MYHLAIVGSRRRTDRERVVAGMRRVVKQRKAEHGAVCIVSGGCRGVDTWAADEARRQGWGILEYAIDKTGLEGAPRWQWAKRAYARNEQIAERCDELLAFVAADRKGGTEHTIACARKLGKPVQICRANGSTC